MNDISHDHRTDAEATLIQVANNPSTPTYVAETAGMMIGPNRALVIDHDHAAALGEDRRRQS